MRFWQAGALGALTAGAVLLGPAVWSALVVPQPADDIVVAALFLGSGEPARGGVADTQSRSPTLVSSGAPGTGSSPAPRGGRPTGTPSATVEPSTVEATGQVGPVTRPAGRSDPESSATQTATTHQSTQPSSSSSTPQTVVPTRVVEVDDEATESTRESDRDDD
jgi:hypothetical protein